MLFISSHRVTNVCHKIVELMVKSAEQTGVVLDNIYTAKAANELKELMQNKPEVFKGNRILFLHTGWSSSN